MLRAQLFYIGSNLSAVKTNIVEKPLFRVHAILILFGVIALSEKAKKFQLSRHIDGQVALEILVY